MRRLDQKREVSFKFPYFLYRGAGGVDIRNDLGPAFPWRTGSRLRGGRLDEVEFTVWGRGIRPLRPMD